MSSRNVTSGDLVTIECKVIKGRPSPSFFWYHNSEIVVGKTGKYLFNNEEIKAKDSGSYKCAGQNNAGRSDSSVENIVVHGKAGNDGMYTAHS